eukprot:TRINITY_DN3075_c0_g2_i1.p1 TRINITY_DN3075_c0_g2~~TRINITY_DN3075_c0_g2_i1.p1  ORF type:complete len:300 (+),score=44.94 TRINITY_DN3075_c0_g2_i1:62-901(+)
MACVICKPLGSWFCPEDRPSPLYSTFASIIGSVTLVMCGLYGSMDEIDDCRKTDIRTWFYISMIVCVWNVGFSIYLYYRLKAKVLEGSVAKAVWKLAAYDIGVCLNFGVLIFTVAWLGWGGSLKDDADDVKSEVIQRPRNTTLASEFVVPSACHTMADKLNLVIVLFIVFLVLGFFIILLSICTECCREPRWKKHAAVGTAPPPSSGKKSGCPSFGFGFFSKKSQHPSGGAVVGVPAQQYPQHHGQMAVPQSGPVYAAQPIQLQAVPAAGYPPPPQEEV